jgi:hypothetical protein
MGDRYDIQLTSDDTPYIHSTISPWHDYDQAWLQPFHARRLLQQVGYGLISCVLPNKFDEESPRVAAVKDSCCRVSAAYQRDKTIDDYWSKDLKPMEDRQDYARTWALGVSSSMS